MSTVRDILFGLIETVLENLKLQYKIEIKTVPGMKRAKKRKAWTKDEIAAVAGLNNILYFRLPGKSDITNLQRRHAVLQSRSWNNIKDYLRNNRSKILKL